MMSDNRTVGGSVFAPSRFRRRQPLLALLLAPALVAGCSGGSSSSEEATGPAVTGHAVKAKSSKDVTIVMIPKLTGIPYFNACQKGAEEAAKELGLTLQFQGSTDANSDKQIQLIDSWIVRKPDVIAVSCNNPDELAPALKRARDKGIHVITWDADANAATSKREFFINQASAEGIGNTLVDVMAKEAGADAQTVVITSSLTAPNQSEWLKYMKQHIAEKYPKMKILDTIPTEEDQNKAVSRTQDAIKANPGLKGIWGISSTAFPGAADAVDKSGATGKIAVTGLATPNQMKSFVQKGVVKTVVLWNPVDLGYLTVAVGNALATGKMKPDDTTIDAGRLGKKQIQKDQVMLGDPMQFTKDNIDKFDF